MLFPLLIGAFKTNISKTTAFEAILFDVINISTMSIMLVLKQKLPNEYDGWNGYSM